MDGLCFSTHVPTPGLTEFKKVIEPARAWIEGTELILENGYDFIDLGHLTATYKVEKLGQMYVLVIPITMQYRPLKESSHSFWGAFCSRNPPWNTRENPVTSKALRSSKFRRIVVNRCVQTKERNFLGRFWT
jgi:hypothetical protein